MRKYLILLLLSLPLLARGQVIFDRPLSSRITGYDITAVLDPLKHTIDGKMTAWWVNNSAMPVSDAMLHMYLNAFSSNKSSFVSDGRWSPAGNEGWGYVKIKSMADDSANDMTKTMRFVSPDDGNIYDRTVLQITLPKPVLPGDTLCLKMVFESKLPSPIERTGYNKDYYFVAQWFPKFGVYETAGMRQREADGWNCHQFHPHSEFYSNHSVYNVSVTIPSDYMAGSGGMLLEEVDNGDGTKTVRWRAEDIVDFAWTAWPGYEVVKDKWRGTDITLLTTREGLKNKERQLTAVKNALEYLDTHVGPYPWPHLTFIEPPLIGIGAAGMEYTTLFTSNPSNIFPKFYRDLENVTIHEFGHAYFMGILASNEFEEPWLDEGVNSYWEQRIVDHFYGNGYGMISLPFIKLSDTDNGRSSYVTSPNRSAATNDLPSWLYPPGTYGMMSYSKTALWLHTLEGLIGTETMDDVFREYYRIWAFRHPSGRDFIAVVNDVVKKEHGNKFGENMNWYFDQVLYGNEICDYSLAGVTNRKIRDYSGIVDGDTVTFTRGSSGNDSVYFSMVSISRLGGLTLPVEVLIHFDNGDEVLEQWDGNARYKDFKYTGTRKVDWAKIDPYDKIDLDVNRINNSSAKEQKFTASRRMMNKFVFLMQMMMSVITI
jgi:hypothetical protein